MTQPAQGPERLLGVEIGGKYKIVRVLGEGGMGCVYQGEQKLGTTIRKVAIKTLHEHLSHDPKILARFEREVGTVAALQHPNTIQVFDFGKMDDGTLYIVMEFVEGQSVAAVLESGGAMEPARVQKIMEQVCGSLEEAHKLGIVHRDLKPDNIVLCERAGQKDWVEVLDFGIAKRSTEVDAQEQKLTQQGMVLGTPPYMSPEQFTGKPVDSRSDIYALGVMAYEMLTCELPFSGNTAWEWATAHMTAQPRPMDTIPIAGRIPPAMKAAITRALEKEPNNRFATVTEFFQAFSGGGQVTSMPAAGSAESFGRGKTQMGAPIGPPQYGAPMGTPPGGTPMAPPVSNPYQTAGMNAPPMAPGPYGTPAQGNQAYTPGAFPQPPPMQRKKGGGGLLIALIGLGALLSAGAIAAYFVTSHRSSSGTTTVDTSVPADTGIPTTTLTGATTTTAAPTDTGSAAPLASLNATAAHTAVAPTTATAKHTGTTTTATATAPTTTATATATVPTATATVPTATARPTATVPPANEPKECQLARYMHDKGIQREASRLAVICMKKGGKPPW